MDAIGKLADAANHPPTLDLRDDGVTVRFMMTPDIGGLAAPAIDLARQISAAARELGLTADPAAVQRVQISIDALVIPEVMPFWRAVLGYEQLGDEDLLDPVAHGPSIWFQQMDGPRPQRNRIHVDVSVPHDQAEARVAAALAAGGRLLSDRFAAGMVDAGLPGGQRGRHRHLDGPRLGPTICAPRSTPTWRS